jgi:hypothetical protein
MTTDEKDESSTLPVDPPENDSIEPTNEKKAVVVTPLSKTGYKHLMISTPHPNKG